MNLKFVLSEVVKTVLEVKLQLAVSIILGLLSVALGYFAWLVMPFDALNGMNLLGIVALIGLAGLLIPAWAGFAISKRVKRLPYYHVAVAGALITGVSVTISGVLNLLLVVPLAPVFSQPFGPSSVAFGALSTGLGVTGFIIGRTVAALLGAVLALFGAFISKRSSK